VNDVFVAKFHEVAERGTYSGAVIANNRRNIVAISGSIDEHYWGSGLGNIFQYWMVSF